MVRVTATPHAPRGPVRWAGAGSPGPAAGRPLPRTTAEEGLSTNGSTSRYVATLTRYRRFLVTAAKLFFKEKVSYIILFPAGKKILGPETGGGTGSSPGYRPPRAGPQPARAGRGPGTQSTEATARGWSPAPLLPNRGEPLTTRSPPYSIPGDRGLALQGSSRHGGRRAGVSRESAVTGRSCHLSLTTAHQTPLGAGSTWRTLPRRLWCPEPWAQKPT